MIAYGPSQVKPPAVQMLFHYWPNLKPPGAISEYRGLQYTGQCSCFCVSQNKYEVNNQQCVNCMLVVLRCILICCCFVSCAFIGIYNVTLCLQKIIWKMKKKLIVASDFMVSLQILTGGNRRRNKYKHSKWSVKLLSWPHSGSGLCFFQLLLWLLCCASCYHYCFC